jgi:hypothetical protein
LAFCFVFIGLAGRALQADRVLGLHVAILAVLCFATALGSPSRYAAYILAPALVGLAALSWRNPALRVWGPAVAMLGALPLGYVLNKRVLSGTDFDPQVSSPALDHVLNYPRDIGVLLVKMFEVFRLETVSFLDSLIPSLIAYAYSVALNLAVLVGGALLLAQIARRVGQRAGVSGRGAYESFAILFAGGSLAVIALLLIVTDVPIVARYLMPQVLALGFFALAFAFQHHWQNRRVQALALFIFCVPLLFAATPERNWGAEEGDTRRFADLLNEKGLNYGYITDFWWANKMTLISAGDIAARAVIQESETSVRPYRWLSRRAWYERGEIDPFFLAVPHGSTWRPDAVQEQGTKVLEVFTFDDRFTIFALSGHDAFIRAQIRWLDVSDGALRAEPDTFYTDVGVTKSDDHGTYLENDGPGFLVYGPFVTLQPGRYAFDLRYSCSADATGRIDFYSGNAGRRIDLGPLCDPPRDTVSLSLDKPTRRAELRLLVESGTVRFWGYEGRLAESNAQGE